MAMKIGFEIIDLAISINQHVAVEISRLNQTNFLNVDERLPVDKDNWLTYKANVVKQLEESYLSVKNALKNRNMTFVKSSSFDEKAFLAKDSLNLIFVKKEEMIRTIIVSGLHIY